MSSPHDLVGPVLPQALRLARYQALTRLPENPNEIPSENDTINQKPSREEERLLASNASVVASLEDLFSWSHKDRTSKTSKLTLVESVRFQRAIYRIWLMSVLFGPRRFKPTYLGFNDSDSDEGAAYSNKISGLKKGRKDQKSFLEPFSSQEIVQIDRMARFLIRVAGWADTAEGHGMGGTRYTYDWNGMFLFAGPHIVLRCYEDATTSHLPTQYLDDDGPYEKFLTQASDEIIKERKINPSYGDIGIILDNIIGEDDQCRHCGGAGFAGMWGPEVRTLPDLYNETNWDDLKGRLDREFLMATNLSRNLAEKLFQALGGDWSRLLHQMFACRQDEYSKWSKGDWICTDCWSCFFRDTIWRWRLVQKERAGKHIGSDCKYGYNCREQCYQTGLAHAEQFNHLCKPTDPAAIAQAFRA